MNAPAPAWHEFAEREALARALAGEVAALLSRDIERRGRAVLIVSGGNTPGTFFDELSHAEIEWEKVAVTLADERFVPPDHARSNERLVRERLLRNAASGAQFLPLFMAGMDADEAARHASRCMERLPRPFTAILLGMGTDGHTASIFPDAENAEQLLDPDAPPVLAVRAASAGETRLSLSLAWLLQTPHIVLHIEGAEKKALLHDILSGNALPLPPVGQLLRRSVAPVQVYWAPSGE